MNDHNTPTTAAPAAAIITEGDVVAFLANKAAELSAHTGEEFSVVICKVNQVCAGSVNVEWTTYVDGDNHRSEKSLGEAFGKTVAAMSPAVRAERLRKQAAAILAQAAAIETAA